MAQDAAGLLAGVAALLAGVLGPHAEVVVHDLEKGELTLVHHGEISGRRPGPTDDGPTVRLLAEEADANGCLIGYRSSANGRPLRASNLFVRDETGRLRYAICVNQDLGPLEQAGRLLAELGGVRSLEGAAAGRSAEPRQLIRSIILGEVERAKPFSVRNRAGRLAVLRRLEEQGVFQVRGAVEEVCGLLGVSQATFYNDLRALRGQKEK